MHHSDGIIYSQDPEMSLSLFKKRDWEKKLSPSPELLSWTEKNNVAWTMEGEKDFPLKIARITSKPYILYYMGNLNLLEQSILGIVGPRNHSDYAKQVLDKLFSLAPQYRLVTISGLAPGVDQLCHHLSMTKNIPTIVVLGGGLRRFLRSSRRHLIQKIVATGGLVLSEFKLDQQPQNYTFPQRNRIIAGLSDLIFLPEAGEGSGSLITVDFALHMHKPVYGVPNTIFASTSTGVNQLIASGAIHTVTDIQQFLESCFTKKDTLQATKKLPDLSENEQTVVSFLWGKQTCTLTDFLSMGSLSSQEIISLLTLLEMKGCIHQEIPGAYKLVV